MDGVLIFAPIHITMIAAVGSVADIPDRETVAKDLSKKAIDRHDQVEPFVLSWFHLDITAINSGSAGAVAKILACPLFPRLVLDFVVISTLALVNAIT